MLFNSEYNLTNQINTTNEGNENVFPFKLTEEEDFFINNIHFTHFENENFFNEDQFYKKNIVNKERNIILDNSISDTDKSNDKNNLDTSSQTSKGNLIKTQSSNRKTNDSISLLNKKKGRPITDTNVILTIDNKVLHPNDEDYMKERKKIQNRESQLRSRQRKKEITMKSNEKVEDLMMENERLKTENRNLIEDRSFLVEQIRFLQGLISKNLPLLRHSSEMSVDKEKGKVESQIETNEKKERQFLSKKVYFSSENKKELFNKVVNVGFVALLGVLCILVNIDNKNEIDEYSIRKGGSIGYTVKSEKEVKEVKVKSSEALFSYSFIIRILLTLLFICSFLSMIYSFFFKKYFVKREKLK